MAKLIAIRKSIIAVLTLFIVLPAWIKPALAVPPGHRIGSDEAPIFIEAWLDYANPENLQLHDVYIKILGQFGSDQVQLIVKPFPTRGADDPSYLAAEAAECVAAQGEDMFWIFHSFMLGSYGSWTLDDIWQWAEEFEARGGRAKAQSYHRFSYDRFASCWKGRESRDIVGYYVAEGYRKEVESAPTTLVASRISFEVERFEGLLSYDQLAAAVEYLLGSRLPPWLDIK